MDDFDALRAEVDRHHGRARAHPLVALAVRLVDTYWRVGVGSPAARPYLDEAVEAFEEAYGHFEDGSGPRRNVAGGLGLALGVRHLVHAGPERDRDRAIALLEEESPGPREMSASRQFRTLITANLLLFRAVHSGNLAQLMISTGPPGRTGDLDRAVALLREVADGPQFSADVTTQARTLLEMAEIMRDLLAPSGVGRGPGLDLSAMMTAVTRMKDLQDRLSTVQRVGYGAVPSPFAFMAEEVASDPSRRPVTVIDAPAGAVDAPPAAERPAAPPPVPAARHRAGVREVLPDDGAVLALLDATAPEPPVEVVDRLVSACWSLVRSPDCCTEDRLLLAVALYLRHRADDGGGWGEREEAGGDAYAAAEQLVAAAGDLLDAPPTTSAVMVRTATLLGGAVLDRLAQRFTPVVDALRTVGADGAWLAAVRGAALLSATSGRFEEVGRPRRIVVVGDGTEEHPACPAVTVVPTCGRLVELARRRRRPPAESPVFVANPRGDRADDDVDAMVLRRTFFPGSVGLGSTVEHSSGAGTADELLARLDASVLHLGCAVTDAGGLELADGVLETATIAATATANAAPGGVAVLPPAPRGTAALAGALLAAGPTAVIGFREPVRRATVRLAHFMLLTHLVDRGEEPAAAVGAVGRWLADPHRTYPDHMPAWLAPSPANPELVDPTSGTVLVCFGV